MKIDPQHLVMLASIVDRGGLTEGAEALGKSQPSVSRSLALLEQRVGARLFEANRRPLQPTDLCRTLAAEGRAIDAATRRASDLVARAHEGRLGAVRVGGTPFFLDGVVAGMIAAFQVDEPGIRVEQRSGYREELISALEAGTLDLLILPLRDDDIPEGTRTEPLLRGHNVVTCRIGHPLARNSDVRLADIAPFPWIAPPADSPLYRDLRDVLGEIGVRDVRISFTGGSLAAVQTVLSGSDALTVLPFSVVHQLRHQKLLMALPVRIGHPDRHLCLLSRLDTDLSRAAERFSKHIRVSMRAISDEMDRIERRKAERQST